MPAEPGHEDAHNESLRELHDSLLSSLKGRREAVSFGGLTAFFHPSSKVKWMNSASLEGAVSRADAERYLAECSARGIEPWMEYSLELFPEAESVLLDVGLVRAFTMPVMLLRSEGWSPASATARPPTREELSEALTVASTAFDSPEPSIEEIDQTWQSMESGVVLAAAAWSGDRCVSVGQAIGDSKVREIAGLATDQNHRRKGFCTQVIHSLLNQHFGAGGTIAWLTPGDDGAELVYRKAGFQTVGTQGVFGFPDSAAS